MISWIAAAGMSGPGETQGATREAAGPRIGIAAVTCEARRGRGRIMASPAAVSPSAVFQSKFLLCNQCWESASGWIQNFFLDTDRELLVSDPDPG